MLAGEVVYRNRDRLSRATVVALATVAPLAGTVQFLAWYLNGRRAAVGTGGPLLFLSDPECEPPLAGCRGSLWRSAECSCWRRRRSLHSARGSGPVG